MIYSCVWKLFYVNDIRFLILYLDFFSLSSFGSYGSGNCGVDFLYIILLVDVWLLGG